MVLLVIDTCTERLLTGVRRTGKAPEDRWINIDSREGDGPGNHARDLLPTIQELLGDARPDAVGVALGPGSFTGVRIGLATAKGLAAGWDVPLVGLDNLAAMAQAWQTLESGSQAAVLPVIDARKKKFYGALYRGNSVLVGPSDLGPGDWVRRSLDAWTGPVVLSGYQGSLLGTALAQDLPPTWSVLDVRDWCPALLDQAEEAAGAQRYLGPEVGPRYLRLSEAEENLRLRQA